MKKLPPNSGLFAVSCTDIVTKCGPDRLLFRLYYPTAEGVATNDTNSGSWLMGSEYAAGYTNFLSLRPLRGLFGWLFSNSRVNAVMNGAFKLPNQIKKLPVVVFSHGLGANRTCYSYICTDLASKGVLVAALEHADKSACATFYLSEENDENPATQQNWINYQHVKSGSPTEHSTRNEQVHRRAVECCKLLNEIQQINDGQANYACCEIDLEPFKGAIDVNKCAVMGHSFGGGTAITALSKDDRFKVGIGLDTWMYPLDREVYRKISPVPFLFINTESFQWAANIADMRKLDADVFNIDAERLMVTLKGTVHFSQTDFPLLVDNRFLSKLFNVTGPTDPLTVVKLNNQLAFGFLGKHLGLDFGNSVKDVVSENADLVYFDSNVKVDEEQIKKSKDKLRSQS